MTVVLVFTDISFLLSLMVLIDINKNIIKICDRETNLCQGISLVYQGGISCETSQTIERFKLS